MREGNHRAPTAWDREEIFHDADGFFDGLCRAMEAAAQTIDLQMYIFDDDVLGRRIVGALGAAGRRGVRVRLLVDGVGSPGWPGRLGAPLAEAGVDVRVYHPLPWSFSGGLGLLKSPGLLGELLRTLNHREHGKCCIVDGRSAWLGSMNVRDCSLRAVHGDAAWRECGVRVEGSETSVLTDAFEYSWDRAVEPFSRFVDPGMHSRRVARFRSARLLRINCTRRLRRRNHRDLVARMRAARQRIWIETPYFVPTPGLAWALQTAGRRGADVRILVPKRSDVFFMPWVIPALLVSLLLPRVRAYEYLPAMLHAKITIVDDWMMVGSSNLNRRSLLHDREADAVITSPEARRSLEERFALDLSRSEELSAGALARRPWTAKAMGRLLLPLRNWM